MRQVQHVGAQLPADRLLLIAHCTGTSVTPTGSLSAGRRQHAGRSWDYVFDVELDGGVSLKLACDDAENPYDVAERFLAEHDLPGEFKEQARLQCSHLCSRVGCGMGGGQGLGYRGPCTHHTHTYTHTHQTGAVCPPGMSSSGTQRLLHFVPTCLPACLSCPENPAPGLPPAPLLLVVQIVRFVLDNTGAGRGRGPRTDAGAPITGGFCDPFTGGSSEQPTAPPHQRPTMVAPTPGDVTGGGVDPFTGAAATAAAVAAAAAAPTQGGAPAAAYLLFDVPPPSEPLRRKLLELSGGGEVPESLRITAAELAPGGAQLQRPPPAAAAPPELSGLCPATAVAPAAPWDTHSHCCSPSFPLRKQTPPASPARAPGPAFVSSGSCDGWRFWRTALGCSAGACAPPAGLARGRPVPLP